MQKWVACLSIVSACLSSNTSAPVVLEYVVFLGDLNEGVQETLNTRVQTSALWWAAVLFFCWWHELLILRFGMSILLESYECRWQQCCIEAIADNFYVPLWVRLSLRQLVGRQCDLCAAPSASWRRVSDNVRYVRWLLQLDKYCGRKRQTLPTDRVVEGAILQGWPTFYMFLHFATSVCQACQKEEHWARSFPWWFKQARQLGDLGIPFFFGASTKPQGQETTCVETTCIFSWIEIRFLDGTHTVAPAMAAESKARIGMLWLLAACLV